MLGSTVRATIVGIQQPQYDHTQRGPMYWLILAPACVLLPAITFVVNDSDATFALTLVAVIMFTMAFSFRTLRVVDEGEMLTLRYGPIPLFRKRFNYADILAAERDRSAVIDGWGMHWVPGRGRTYNLWGFDCVRLTLRGDRTARIGTDDPENLERLLQGRIRKG
jgi:hypothetical protein